MTSQRALAEFALGMSLIDSHLSLCIFMLDASQVVSLGQLSQMSIRLCLLQPEERAKYQTCRSKACLCTPSGHWLSCCQTAPKTCEGR